MNVTRKVTVTASGREVLVALKAAFPESLELQAVSYDVTKNALPPSWTFTYERPATNLGELA